MKKLLLLPLLLPAIYCKAQSEMPGEGIITRSFLDSLHHQLAQPLHDTLRIRTLIILARGFNQAGYPDSQIIVARKALALSQKTGYQKGVAVAHWLIIWAYRKMGRYPQALRAALFNLQRAEQTKDSLEVWEALRHVMFTYNDMQEYKMTLPYAYRSKRLVHSGYFKSERELQQRAFGGYINFIGAAYDGLGENDSALFYKRLAYNTALNLNDLQHLAVATALFGRFFLRITAYDSAAVYFQKCLQYVKKAGYRFDLAAEAQLGLAHIFRHQGRSDSARIYAQQSLKTAHRMRLLEVEAKAAAILHQLYAGTTPKDSAYKYLALTKALEDSLFNQEKIKQTESIKYNEALRLQKSDLEHQQAQAQYNRRIQLYGFIGGAVLVLGAAFFWYRLRQIRHETELTTSFTKKINQIEMRALRAQMNPHFIFNCLNSINRYIVKSDHKTASAYLTKFARLIRLILDNSASEHISLDTELQTLQLYIDMEVLRFDYAFKYAIEVAEDVIPETIHIPSMLLQPYVENAIWHGLLNKEDGGGALSLRFHMSAGKVLTAEVEDNGVGRKKAKELRSKEVLKKKSYGMEISKDRIFLINQLYNTNASVQVQDLIDEKGNPIGTKVTVQLPVLTV